MPGRWGEFTRLLSSSINENIKKNPQVSRSGPRGLLGSVTPTAIILGWYRWGWGGGVVPLIDKHGKTFLFKAGEIIVATKQIRFKCVSITLSIPCVKFLF